MTDNLITQGELEGRMGGPKYLIQCTDDDGDGVADPAVVADILDCGSRIAEGLLWDGWPSKPAIDELVLNDAGVRVALADICCGLAGDRRPEWINTQTGAPFWSWRRERGEKYLRDVVERRRRSIAEGRPGVGLNGTMKPRISGSMPPTFTFATSQGDRKGPGGF